MNFILTLPVPILDEEKKLSQIFIVTLLCDASKVFTKALKAFKKPFKAPQRSVKIKFKLNVYFNTTFRKARTLRLILEAKFGDEPLFKIFIFG